MKYVVIQHVICTSIFNIVNYVSNSFATPFPANAVSFNSFISQASLPSNA